MEIMKRNFKFLIIFMVTILVLTGCKKDSSSQKVENKNANANSVVDSKEPDENSSDKEASIVKENLKHVEGAEIGSMSSYVEDREIWEDFVDEKYKHLAMRNVNGIHIPKILLDSKDASIANSEIEELIKQIKTVYEDNKKEFNNDDIGIYSSFSVYQDEKILSLKIESSNIWEGQFPIYKIFNFSLPDGKALNDYELLSKFGIKEENFLGIIEDNIRDEQNRMSNVYFKDVMDNSFINNPENMTGIILNDIWDNYDAKKNQIFIDEVGYPNLIYKQYAGADMGYSPQILKLTENRFKGGDISDEYIKMARKLGIDPKDEKYKAFIILLGAAYDNTTLAGPLEKLFVWQSAFSDYEDPNILLTIKDEQGELPYLIGQECYLLIPKYKNASVSLKELEITEDGKLKEAQNIYLDNLSTTGTTFICQNISDIAPNAKIKIRYRDDVLEFSPFISLKDGSLELPDEVMNAENILDWKSLIRKDSYSYTMYERILSIMGMG